MGLFHTPPPRRFRLPPIYIDERQERLQRLEQRAKAALETENSEVANGETIKQAEMRQRYELSDRKLINARSSFGFNLWQLCLFLGVLLIALLVLFFL